MTDKPQYIIIAGVNGAGKSTLYENDKVEQDLFLNTKRINADEISKQHGWDWKNQSDNFKAMKIEVREIHASIKARESFHIETTLAGAGKAHINIINEAKKQGYEISLFYVGLESADLAIQRVKRRVEKGGHGIDDTTIRQRYTSSLNNLSNIMNYCDNILLFDNTKDLKLVFEKNHDTIRIDKRQNVTWLKNRERLMDDLPREEKKPVSEKSQALLKQAEDGIKEFLESDKYKDFLKTMSKFHQYSINNTILIAQQKPDAQLVAGFKAWQNKFKRQVNKDEKAIKIIGCRPYEQWVDKEVDGKKERQKIQGFSFFPVSVFDVSQTKGEPLPQLTAELTANVNGYRDLYHAIKRSTAFKIGFEEITSGAKGYCDMTENRIALNKGMSESQTIKTLIHEVTHADLHAPEFQDKTVEKTSLRTKETEAESVALVVCEHYGIDTSDYSFPYLGSWAKDKELSELKESFERIQTQADDLIQRIDTNLEDVQKEQSIPEKTEPKQDQKLSLDEKIKQAKTKADNLNLERKKEQLLQNQKESSKNDMKKDDREL